MVIEESSVVAAASSAAKYWMTRGGFRAKVLSTQKVGQVHFEWLGDARKLEAVFEELKAALREHVRPITHNMEQRGGGVSQSSSLTLPMLSHIIINSKLPLRLAIQWGPILLILF